MQQRLVVRSAAASLLIFSSGLLPLRAQVTLAADSHAEDEQAIAGFEARIKAGDYAETRTALESYVAARPTSWRAAYQLGYVDFRLHRVRESLAELSRSLSINDQFAAAHKILAFDLNILGRKDLALAELHKAEALAPDDWEVQYELGRICYEQGSYVEAARAFEKVKQWEPEIVKTYHNLGLAYAGTGDREKAISNFECGLALNAKQQKPSAWPLIDYATYLNMESEFGRARDLLLRAVQMDSSWAQEHAELAKSYRGLGDIDAAIDSLRKAISLAPNEAATHYMLAQLWKQKQRSADAARELLLFEKLKRAQSDYRANP